MSGAPDTVGKLVDRFERNREAYRSGRYNETQVRVELIDPLLIALGWDVHNAAGDRGCLTLSGKPSDHELLPRHIAEPEQWVDVQALGRTVREWSPNPAKPDNPCPPTCPA